MSPVSRDFRKQVEGYGLTTAQIIYRVPAHLELLQDFVWQQYDVFPQFPSLRKFLAFWEQQIEGPLHSVTVSHARLIKPSDFRAVSGEFYLN